MCMVNVPFEWMSTGHPGIDLFHPPGCTRGPPTLSAAERSTPSHFIRLFEPSIVVPLRLYLFHASSHSREHRLASGVKCLPEIWGERSEMMSAQRFEVVRKTGDRD
ncbi:hypothetical protein CEXT_750621 [Caerostris extrusa]|uniref:Uncharacterized protein n=1 Tax=Caerostris extrusa TaxID=172846 RepID=A0AAV4TNU0_CAEEX|nr:hypothetical protein CEXT_750621 [Caerostris extrusa]